MELLRLENKNYAVDSHREGELDELTLNMLKAQRLHCLLPLRFRYVDDRVMTEFDISGWQPMNRLYDRRKLKQEDIAHIIRLLAVAVAEMEEYLLGVESLYLEPELMFMDPEGRELRLCCNIGVCTEENPYRQLLCYFMDHVDYLDRESVGMAYSLVRLAEGDDPLNAMLELVGAVEHEEIKEEKIDEPLPEPEVLPVKKRKRFSFFKEKKERRLLIETGALTEGLQVVPKEKYVTQPLDYKIVEKHYYLRSMSGDDNGQRRELDHFPYVIGKLEGQVDYRIDSPMVSRLHAQFTLEKDGLAIEDLNSSNGTYINGASAFGKGHVPLKDGDVITFADKGFKLEIYAGR